MTTPTDYDTGSLGEALFFRSGLKVFRGGVYVTYSLLRSAEVGIWRELVKISAGGERGCRVLIALANVLDRPFLIGPVFIRYQGCASSRSGLSLLSDEQRSSLSRWSRFARLIRPAV